MSIYSFAILALLASPLLLWAWRNSQSHRGPPAAASLLPDLTAAQFTLRVFALLLGYAAIYGLSGGPPAFILGQALVPVGLTVVLFSVTWCTLRLLRRSILQPRRRLFELALFVFCITAILLFVVTKTEQIRNASALHLSTNDA
jgi:hypothetical protein